MDAQAALMAAIERASLAADHSSSSSSLSSSSLTRAPIAQKICKFFKIGACRFGTSCRNAHHQPHLPGPSGSTTSAEPGPSTSFAIDSSQRWQLAPVPMDTEFERNSRQNPEEYLHQQISHKPFAAAALENIEQHVHSLFIPYSENNGVCVLYVCELCGKRCLNPFNEEQQRQHNVDCIKQHELDMERSKDKICGLCQEVIFQKPSRYRRFGILPNCKHIFCLECIQIWWEIENLVNKRRCPTCGISSDFVCPSFVWVESREKKDKLINDYKKACSTTHCKHFRQGAGNCPFRDKCFYKHVDKTCVSLFFG